MKEILKELMKYFITKGAIVTKDLQNYHFCASRFAAFIVPFYAPKEKGFLKKFKGNLYFCKTFGNILEFVYRNLLLIIIFTVLNINRFQIMKTLTRTKKKHIS